MANSFDENTMNNIKNMVDSGNIQGAISQISPEMIENFSKMMNNTNNNSNMNHNNTYSENSNSSKNNPEMQNSSNYSNSNNYNSSGSTNFDFSNIDINTVMKMKSVMDKMNSKSTPGYNLLYSLKPYMRDSKKEKIDQYANLLNFSQIAEILKNDNSINGK